MIDVAYTRLEKTLWDLAHSEGLIEGSRAAEAVLDAWAMVDATHRLRELLRQVPGLKRGPPLQLFLKNTEEFEALRHKVQHLRKEIHDLAQREEPAWGRLSWVAAMDDQAAVVRSCTLVAGAWPREHTK